MAKKIKSLTPTSSQSSMKRPKSNENLKGPPYGQGRLGRSFIPASTFFAAEDLSAFDASIAIISKSSTVI